ncbi:carboxypeptidase M32 [Natronosalvus rutilus]|uniref:Metal-dependent carboxypeptidase n=1 Tax=Natronosalvus rutilus TaxID=2953753 RepID=A0A9E7NE72_9EURY|nr:carboxypeptidase M32 [Natronosalvus rutilus]UTF55701.1 carboxypeptidase M32 [Natronosalvus rutilus]
MSGTDDPYQQFAHRIRNANVLDDVSLVLNWDQQVVMPEEGSHARSLHFSALSAMRHELFTGEQTLELLETIDDSALNDEQHVILREARREIDRKRSVPGPLVEEISVTQTQAFEDWKIARAEKSFDPFAESLGELVQLQRERTDYIDASKTTYGVLLGDTEPYMEPEDIDRLLTTLRDGVLDLLEEYGDDLTEPDHLNVSGPFEEDKQQELCERALTMLGYNWSRGRLDTAPHPFDGLSQYDARITTRFDESEPFSALLSTIHEFGHAVYNLGLSDEHYGTALGRARSHSIHESQSRFFENHVGRSRAFWERFLPTMREIFPQFESVSLDEVLAHVNRINRSNQIRVEADEVTYHLHIALRHEIEQQLLEGEIAVEEVPTVWNERAVEYFGEPPESVVDGVLQDVHWSSKFGMFPNYSLGSMLAAQVANAIDRGVADVDTLIREDRLDEIHNWLTQHIHQRGQRDTTGELIERATGEPLSAEPLLDHLEANIRAQIE